MSENKRLLMSVNGDPDEEPVIVRQQQEPCMAGCFECCGKVCGALCLIGFCGCCCNPYQRVRQGYRGIVTRFGALSKVLSPGLHYVNPISEELIPVDVMLHVQKLSNQAILTKDNLPITIDGAVYYRTKNTPKDVVTAKTTVYNVNLAVNELAHSTLRLVFGQHTLQEALEKRKDFAAEIKKILGDQATQWGIQIYDIQIIDVVIPKHIQDLLATSAVAAREGEAEVIMAKARVQSAHLMREAADQLNTPAAMQMRQLETYKVLAESENSKIIFMPSAAQPMDNLTANIVAEGLRSAVPKQKEEL